MVRWIAALALVLATAGCDDTDISRIERRSFLSAPALAKELGTDALLVELHGLPWPGANPDEVIGTLRMPKGKARAMRFQSIPPGQGYLGTGKRLVLRFNPPGAPHVDVDCRATRPLPVQAPAAGRFSVNATYCKGSDWQIRAYMEADVDPQDWLAYYLAMEELLGVVFARK